MRRQYEQALDRWRTSGMPDMLCRCWDCPCPTYRPSPGMCRFCIAGQHASVRGLR